MIMQIKKKFECWFNWFNRKLMLGRYLSCTFPSGYSIYLDENHPGKLFSRHWHSTVDYLI